MIPDQSGRQQYGSVRTPPRRSYRAADEATDGRRLSCKCWRRCAASSQSPLKARDAEAGGRSPGLTWRTTAGKDGIARCGMLIQQRCATHIWVALFFSVPLLSFFVGKRYVGDVPAGVLAAVLLQLMVTVYVVWSAQAVARAEPNSPHSARKNR